MYSWKRAAIAGRLLMTLFALSVSGIALGQGVPPLTPFPSAETPPRECTAEPVNLDRIREITGSALNDPAATIEDAPLYTGGETVTGDAADAVRVLALQMISCVNENQPARFLSLFTDDFYRRAGNDIAGIIEAAEMSDGSEGPLDDMMHIVEESDVFALPDGRLSYTITIGWFWSDDIVEPLEPEQLIQIVAIEHDGVWLIDDLRFAYVDDLVDGPDCARDGEGCATPAGATYVDGGTYAGWIMPADAATLAPLYFLPTGTEVVAPFVPTIFDVAEAEAALPDFVAGHALATDRLIAALQTGGHDRQYLGVETTDGRLLIINAYCSNPAGVDPTQFIVSVDDGGDCFWHAVYDLTAGEFRSLSVNGDA